MIAAAGAPEDEFRIPGDGTRKVRSAVSAGRRALTGLLVCVTFATVGTLPATQVGAGERPLTVAFGGDVHFERHLSALDTPGRLDPLSELLAAELAIVNLETSIGSGGRPERKSYTFRAGISHARALAAAGIDAVAVANNHFIDYGSRTAMGSLELLERVGLPAAGAGGDVARAVTPVILYTVTGRKVALFSVTTREPFADFDESRWVAGEDTPGLLFWESHRSRLLDAVRDERTAGRHPVVMVHWGDELRACPTELQRRVGRALVDAGAVAVIGSHPHVLGPVENYRGSTIAYSLGNFVWYHRRPPETAALVVRIDASGRTSHLVRPALIGDDGVPRRVTGHQAAGILGRTTRRC